MDSALVRQAARVPVATVARYEKLGFTTNPFPPEPALSLGSPDPRRNGEIYSDTLHEDKREKFAKLLVPSRGLDGARSIVFLMDHASRRGRGIGKTAFLHRRRKEILEDLGYGITGGQEVVCAAHVIPSSTPQIRRAWEFARLVLATLNEQEVLLQAVCRLRATYPELPSELTETIGPPENWRRTIADDQWLRERLREKLPSIGDWDPVIGVNRHVRTQLMRAGIDDEISDAIAYKGNDPERFKREYLERLTDYWWRKDGGRCVFDGFVKALVAAGFTRGLLLVDEVEKIVFTQNQLERRTFVDALRWFLIDGDCEAARQRFYGLLLTIHPGVQELLLPHWKAAGLDRLTPLAEPDAQQCTIYLGPLKSDQAEPLVRVYLDHFRISDDKRGNLDPFDPSAIQEALLLANGVPGPMLNLLYRVIERAADEGRSTIDKDLVKKTGLATVTVPDEPPPHPSPLPGMKAKLTDLE